LLTKSFFSPNITTCSFNRREGVGIEKKQKRKGWILKKKERRGRKNK
jgi:hypothetical protein